MTVTSAVLIFFALVLFVAGQLLLKHAMESTLYSTRFTKFFATGLTAMTISFFITLGLLQQFDLSYLYPFQGLSVVIISILAAAILRADWRERFEAFARNLGGSNLYVTIDLDCLAPEIAWTNWESGRFTLDDVRWGLETLREHTRIIAGDMCGAYSKPSYARRKQRFASEMDHPQIDFASDETIRAANHAAFAALWPALAQ